MTQLASMGALSKQLLTCILITSITLFTSCSRLLPSTNDDLSQKEGTMIKLAMGSGEASSLPDCTKITCTPSKTRLLLAATLRINGDLEMSMRVARQCFSSSEHELVTHYTCARLINMNGKDIGGLYGEKSTIIDLADAAKALYASHAFGVQEDFNSSSIKKRKEALDRLLLEPETVVFDNTVKSIPLFGFRQGAVFIGQRSGVLQRPSYLYPSVKVEINGQFFKLRIDTGSQVSSLTASAANRAKLDTFIALRDSVKSLSGKDVLVGVAIVKTFRFANVAISNKSVHVIPDSAGNPGELGDGFVGWDVLRKVPAFEFKRSSLAINPDVPTQCNGELSLSSDINTGGVLGVATKGSFFNGRSVVTVFDSGNNIAGILPTLQLARRQRLEVVRARDINLGVVGGYSVLHSGSVVGRLNYLGIDYSGTMVLGANFPEMPIDFDIGLPLFFDRAVYVNLGKMRMCSAEDKQSVS